MRDVQVLHLVLFLNDNEPLPGIIFRGQRVLILGAGVSAAAVGVSLAEGGGENGARHIAFHDPAPGKSAGVAARIDAAFDATVVVAPDGREMHFDIDAHRKYCLVNGLDEIGLTLRHADEIRAFEAERLARHAWLDVRPIVSR